MAQGKIGLEQNAKLVRQQGIALVSIADSGIAQRKRRQEIIDNAVKTYKTELADEAKEAAAKRKRELDQKKYE